MFEAEMENITLLRDSVDTISELIDEAEIEIKDEGIEIKASDRAVVSVVDFSMSKNVFSSYKVDQETKVGLNLSNFLQILRRATPDDKVLFALDGNKLKIVIKGDSTRKFTMPLIDISKEDAPDLNKLESGFSSSLIVDSNILHSGIEDAELVTDSVVLTLRKDMFSIKAESDAASTHLEIPNDSNMLKVDGVNEPIRARYSLDYLKKMMKARKLAEKTKIFMATDYPMKMQFEQPEKLMLSFILAPRVEES
jgi:proliferating cell nuclear antigen